MYLAPYLRLGVDVHLLGRVVQVDEDADGGDEDDVDDALAGHPVRQLHGVATPERVIVDHHPAGDG